MSGNPSLVEDLPPLQRLALSYAPAAAREPTLALLALDARLAGILRGSSEPMLAQLRYAWWREHLRIDSSGPVGEPLLAALRRWGGNQAVLAGLVDGWEAMTGAAPLPPAALRSLAEARGAAFAALAELVGAPDDRVAAARLGGNWALVDLFRHLSHPEEREVARRLAEACDWRTARLSRQLRPLVVLHGLAARAIRREGGGSEASPATLLVAMRLGLLGR